MENKMDELLLDICKRKIDNGMSFEGILDFIKIKNAEDMFAKIHDRLKEYIDKQETTTLKISS
jgi:hypothetical protein